jgi:hypothetical protein
MQHASYYTNRTPVVMRKFCADSREAYYTRRLHCSVNEDSRLQILYLLCRDSLPAITSPELKFSF